MVRVGVGVRVRNRFRARMIRARCVCVCGRGGGGGSENVEVRRYVRNTISRQKLLGSPNDIKRLKRPQPYPKTRKPFDERKTENVCRRYHQKI